MNKRSVNISSLVILLSLICSIIEISLYYFIPQHYITIGFAIVASLIMSHFFLESSLNYDYNFLHSSFMVVTALIFWAVVYAIQPNKWINYDFWLVILVLVNWLTPFVYCSIRDLFDRGPRFDGYHTFFKRMCISFALLYILVLAKQYFITPIFPPYSDFPFGAHNFVPFMAKATYIETVLREGKSLIPMFVYITEMICMGIPFGFLARTYCHRVPFILRIFIYLAFPAVLEVSQYCIGISHSDIDDYVMTLIGITIGLIIFHIINAIYQSMTNRDFMLNRNKQQRRLY